MDPPSAPLLRLLLAGLLLAFVGGVAASLATEARGGPAASDAVLRRPVRDAPVVPPLDVAGAAAADPRPRLFPLAVRPTAPPRRQVAIPPSVPPRRVVLPRAPPRA